MANVRIQFEVTKNKADDINQLMSDFGLTTKRELFSYALMLLEWVRDEQALNHDIASVDRLNNKLVTLKLPIFSNVKRSEVA